jgi:Nuclease-related domain
MTRVAGQHARHRVRTLGLRTLLAIGGIVSVTVVAALALGWRSPAFVLVELAAIGAIYLLDRLAMPVIDRWDRGAEGEEHVGKVLDALVEHGWRPLHDVSFGRGNIDHVLVGPGGLFTIETKSHRGRINVANIDVAMLKQACAQRKTVERLTDMPAEALLVFSRGHLDRPVCRQRGVLVLPARLLAGHLVGRERRLDANDVERIHSRICAALRA